MNPDALGTALRAGAAWTAAAVIGHFVIFHFARVEHRARTVTLLFTLAALAALWTCLLLDVDRWRAVYGVVVVGCSFLLYMPFYYTVAASQSVQLVIEVRAAPHGLSREQIRRRYPVQETLAGRLTARAERDLPSQVTLAIRPEKMKVTGAASKRSKGDIVFLLQQSPRPAIAMIYRALKSRSRVWSTSRSSCFTVNTLPRVASSSFFMSSRRIHGPRGQSPLLFSLQWLLEKIPFPDNLYPYCHAESADTFMQFIVPIIRAR